MQHEILPDFSSDNQHQLEMPMPDQDFFMSDEDRDKSSLKKGDPNHAYNALAAADKTQLHKAKEEEVEKRAKLRRTLEKQSLHAKIYSLLSALDLLSSNGKIELRVVVTEKGEMLIAEEGQAGSDRIAHHAMAKFTLDERAKIPDDYYIVNDRVLSSAMLSIENGEVSGVRNHSGGFRLPLGAMLNILVILLQLPNKKLNNPFLLTEVDDKGKDIVLYSCPLKNLREQVYAKFTPEERKDIFDKNNKKVVISLERGIKTAILPEADIEELQSAMSQAYRKKPAPEESKDSPFGPASPPKKLKKEPKKEIDPLAQLLVENSDLYTRTPQKEKLSRQRAAEPGPKKPLFF